MIEGIVRPFQSPRVTQSGAIPLPSVGPVRPASLRWGAVGRIPPLRLSWTVQEGYDEQSRNTDTVRITDPEGGGDFIDVQRTDKLTMAKTGGSGSSLYSPFTADISAAFSEFSADVQSAFSGFVPTFDSEGPQTGPGTTTFTFHPPA